MFLPCLCHCCGARSARFVKDFDFFTPENAKSVSPAGHICGIRAVPEQMIKSAACVESSWAIPYHIPYHSEMIKISPNTGIIPGN